MEPAIMNGDGWKPKWMLWRTSERLTAADDAFIGGIFRRLGGTPRAAARPGLIERRVDDVGTALAPRGPNLFRRTGQHLLAQRRPVLERRLPAVKLPKHLDRARHCSGVMVPPV